MIAQARAGADLALLLDSGDFLQGPLGELLGPAILAGSGARAVHPMVRAMNQLGYDAVTLGNHDLEQGIAFLARALAPARFGVVSANLAPRPQCPLRTIVRPSVMLRRQIAGAAVRIGLTGIAPPQATRWARFALKDALDGGAALPALAREVAGLRQAGADVVVVLCHSGLGGAAPHPGVEAENIAHLVAALPGVDAVLGGHSHEVFPPPGSAPSAGAALVIPGAQGSHLGLIDLALTPRAGVGYAVQAWRVAAIPASEADNAKAPRQSSDGQIATLARSTWRRARTLGQMRAGQLGVHLCSHFAALAPDPAARLVAEACRAAAQAAAAEGAPIAPDLPILGAAAPHAAGGGGTAAGTIAGPSGAEALTLPAGPLCRADLHRIAPFSDPLVVLELTGAKLRAWLERAASVFARIVPGQADQPLLRSDAPLYRFDLIEGLSYAIDLSAPPGARIVGLTLNGAPLAPMARVAVATNGYRAAGGAGFDMLAGARVLHVDTNPLHQHLARHLAKVGPWRPGPQPPWRFHPLAGTSVVLPAPATAVALVDAGLAPPGVTLAAGPHCPQAGATGRMLRLSLDPQAPAGVAARPPRA